MLEPEFLDLTNDTVTIEPLSTHTDYAAPVYSTGQSYPAFVEYGTRLVVGRDGREVVANGTIYVLSTTANIGEQDRVTLPRSSTIRLLQVLPVNDDEGLHHWELAFGAWILMCAGWQMLLGGGVV